MSSRAVEKLIPTDGGRERKGVLKLNYFQPGSTDDFCGKNRFSNRFSSFWLDLTKLPLYKPVRVLGEWKLRSFLTSALEGCEW